MGDGKAAEQFKNEVDTIVSGYDPSDEIRFFCLQVSRRTYVESYANTSGTKSDKKRLTIFLTIHLRTKVEHPPEFLNLIARALQRCC